MPRARKAKRKKKKVVMVIPACSGRTAGGYARAAVLSPQRRKEIAQKAAKARWDNERAGKGKKKKK